MAFEFDAATAKLDGEFDASTATPAKPAGAVRRLADTGLALAKGVVGVPEAAVGVADLVTGGQAGRAVERAGVRFKDAKDVLTSFQSDEQHQADREVQQAEGFVPTLGAMVRNPSTIVNAAAESAPSMILGGGVSRGALRLSRGMSPITAGAVGEGVVAAGQNAEQVRQEDPNGLLTGKQSAILGASGVATGAISRISGGVANKLGIGDVNTMLAAGKIGAVGEKAAAAGAGKGVLRKAGEGFVNEGVLQELPQSAQEQAAQNLAQGKPIGEGVGAAAAQGLLVGGLTGAVAGPLQGAAHQITPPPGPGAGVAPDMGKPLPMTPPAPYVPNPPNDAPQGFETPLPTIDPAAGPLSAAASMLANTDGVIQALVPPGPEAVAAHQAGQADQAAQQQAAVAQDTSTQAITKGPIAEAQMAPQDLHAQAVGGDILNGDGKPFANRLAAARRAKLEGADWGITPIAGGFAVRRKEDIKDVPRKTTKEKASAQTAQTQQVSPPPETGRVATPDAGRTGADAPPADQPAAGGTVESGADASRGPRGALKAVPDENSIQANQDRPTGDVIQGGPPEVPQRSLKSATPEAGQPAKAASVSTAPQDSQPIGEVTREASNQIHAPANTAAPADTGQQAPDAPVDQPLDAVQAVDAAAHAAATSPLNDRAEPTQAQKEAGNYRKGHVTLHGLDISIENPRGSTRSGKRPDGSTWSHEMSDHYGYVKRTVGADDEQVDVYVGPKPESTKVFVIDQIDQQGAFDEHKAMLGFDNQMQAMSAYRSNFDKGWKVGPVTAMTTDEFKAWLKSDGTKAPVAGATQSPSAPRQDTPAPSRSSAVPEAALPRPTKAEAIPPAPASESAGPAADGLKKSQSEGVAASPNATPVSTFLGKFGKGMAEANAQMKAANLNKTGEPGITYTAEKHGDASMENEWAVVGRKAGAASSAVSTPPAERWKSYEVVPALRAGRMLVREPRKDGSAQNLAEFTPGKSAVEHFFESESTRAPVLKAIEAWRAKQGSPAATTPARTAVADDLHERVEQAYLEAESGRALSVGLQMTAKKMATAISGGNLEMLQEIIHPDNKISRKAFQLITGLTLPTGVQGSYNMAATYLASTKPKPVTPQVPAPKAQIVVDKAEIRPYRKADGSVGYEAVPSQAATPAPAITSLGDGYSVAASAPEMALRKLAHVAEQPGDVQLGNGKFVTEDQAAAAARQNMTEPQWGMPFQFNQVLDIAPVDWTRMVKVMTGRDYGSPTGNTDAPREKVKPAVKANTVFTEDAAAAARARLKSKLGRLNSGLDPETMMDGITLAGYHIEKGARTFAAFAKAMIDDLGDGVTPYLKSWYMGVRYDPRASAFEGMSSAADVDAVDMATIETTPEKADTAPKEPHGTRKLDSPSPGPLEGASAQDVRAPGAGGKAGGSADRSGDGNVGGNAPSDNAGSQLPGGVGAGAGDVSVPAGGAGANAKNAKKPRVPRAARTDAGNANAGDAGGRLAPSEAPNAPAVTAPQIKAEDFTIEDDFALGEGGQKAKFKDNVAAIRLVAELEAADRVATPAEQLVLAKYVGWGGISQAFDPDHKDWGREHAELKALMTPDEFAAAARSTRYAHYTSRAIIVDGIYAAMRRFGFTGGKTLEAGAGVGNFMGLMPADMRSAGRFTAIEREPFSSAIARHLYPQQNVQRADFTEFKGNDAYYDAAVGNPPFASDPQTDRSGRKHLSGLSLHNYFFAKAVDMLREGGLMAQVVTNSFLDAKTDSTRKYISDRVKFLGAIRLPNSAFAKNANTEVTTDIIFLQKRADSEIGGKASREDAKRWLNTGLHVGTNRKPVALNQYFIDNPAMMLGDYGAFGTMYGPDQPALVMRKGQDTLAMLKEAVGKLPEGVYKSVAETGTASHTSAAILALNLPPVKEGGYFYADNKLVQRLPDLAGEARGIEITPATQWTEKTKLGDQGFARITALAEMRGTTRALIAAEMADKPADMTALRATLNQQYDAYRDTHGLLNDPLTLRVFEDDPDFPLLASLEHGYTPGIGLAAAKRMGVKSSPSTARKGPIFTQRVVAARKQVKTVASAADALDVSMAERGRLDAAYIGELLGKDADQVLRELSDGDTPMLFRDPATDEYVLRDAYLSGNVRAKLTQAKAAGMFANAQALEKVQPEDVPGHEITARLGSPWVPTSIYKAFAESLFGDEAKVHVGYLKTNSSFQMVVYGGSDVAMHNTWGTRHYPGDAMLSALMNNRAIKVTQRDSDGKTHTLVKETEDANTKAQELRDRFGDWLFSDPERSEILTKAYNETNNNYVTRVYQGGHMTFPGKVPDSIIKFRRHQRNAIARIVQDRTALLDHVVGAGKTFTIVSGAMELKRTGLARKPMVAVPNHLVKQWAADFYRLYPGANVLTATKKDFEKINRRRFLARIATGDWDAVVIAHSSFGFIRPAPEFEAKFNTQQVAEIVATIRAVDEGDGDKATKKRTVKQLEGMKERLENRIRALRDKPMDDLLDFEQIGVDQLFVDEAHMFKNLMYSTKMQGVAGLQDPSGSQRAYDMYVKTHQIYDKNGRGQGVVFATGTPISNSLAEMYHMMRYLMPAQMKELGFESFDAWANTFASVEQVWMQAPSGDGFKASNRMSNFVNTTELLKMFDQVSDTVTMDDIKKAYSEENKGAEFPLPVLKTGRRIPVSLDKSPAQDAYMLEIAARAKAIEKRKGPPQKGDDNILVVMGDARKAAMDIRLVDPNVIARYPGGRIDAAAGKAMERYDKYHHVNGTQLIFSDLGTPLKHAKTELKEFEALQARLAAGTDDVKASAAFGKESALEILEDVDAAQAELDAKGPDWIGAVKAAMRGFSVYDDFKAALLERGVPEAEIAFIHDYNTDDQKATLFRKVNSGQIRFLMGSTAKLGAGTNVQERLVAEHHLDVPWRPSDVEQREGRIVRQGNKLMDEIPGFEIEILAYVTKDTLDMRMWQVQENKLKMINQLRTRKIGREIDNAFEDMELSAGEMQAAATGDTNLLKEITLRNDVKKLEQKRRSFEGQRNDLINRKKRAAENLSRLPRELEEAKALAVHAQKYVDDLNNNPAPFSMNIDGTVFTDAAAAGKHLEELTSKREPAMKDGKPVLDDQNNPTTRAAPISIVINGETLKNRNTVAELYSEARGDLERIKWSVKGEDYRRRATLANAIRQNVVDAIADEAVKPIGKFAGFDVAVEGSTGKAGAITLDVTLSMDGEVQMSHGMQILDAARAPDLAIRSAENQISSAVSRARYLQMDLNRAQKDAKDLEQVKVPDAWPDEAKLEAARAAHKEVLAVLKKKEVAEAAPAEAPATDTDVSPLPEPDRYQRLGVGPRHLGQGTFNSKDAPFARKGANLEALLRAATSGGQTVAQVRAITDPLAAKWNIPVQVVATPKDLPIDAPGDARGLYMNGSIYVVASTNRTPASVMRTLGHEAIAHHGLRQMLGRDDWRRMMNQIQFAIKAGSKPLREIQQKVRSAYADDNGEFTLTPTQEADEIAAAAVERAINPVTGEFNPGFGWLKSVFAKVAKFLRDMGLTVAFTNLELQGALVNSMRNMERGGRAQAQGQAVAAARNGTQLARPGGLTPYRSDDAAQQRKPTAAEVAAAKDRETAQRTEQDQARASKGEDTPIPDWMRSGQFARGPQALADITRNLQEATSPIGTVSLWDKTVGTQYHKATKDRDFKRVFDGYVQQTDDTAHYAIEAEKNAPDILMRLESVGDIWKGLTQSGAKQKANLVAVSKALFANIEGEEGIKQVKYDDTSLKVLFNLNPKQIEMYHQARAAVDTSIERLAQTYAAQMGRDQGMAIDALKNMSLEDTVAAVKTWITDQHSEQRAQKALAGDVKAEGEDVNVPRAPTQKATNAQLDQLDALAEHAKFLQDNAYMPALRFGEFAVTVTGKDGETLHFEMFESKFAANMAAMRVAKEFPGAAVVKSVMNPQQYAMFKGVSPETVELFAKFTGMEKDQAYQDYIALAKSARSVKMRELKRKGIAGFSEDATRVLASFVTSNARQSAINMNIGAITDALASKDLARKGDVQLEAQKLHQYMSNPLEEARRLRGFMFMHFMGGSVASALVNLTQPVLQTAPYLHQFAGGKTARIMLSAAKMAATGNIDNVKLREAAKRAAADGITEPHEIHQLMADASGSAFGGGLKARAAIKAWGSFFALTEAYNRRVTFLAAYQTAQETGQADPYEFARKAVIETQGLYAKANRPNWARGAVGATLFTFKQFSIAYVEFIARLPRKQKLLALTLLVLAAGLQGLPGADDLEDVIDTIGQSMGYNTNSKKALRKMLLDTFGEDLGEVLNAGVFTKSSVDLQGRLGMGNLFPGTAIFLPSETDKSRTLSELAGPLGGILQQFQKALGSVQRGDPLGAVREMAPSAVRNFLQGVDMAHTGVYKDSRGYKVSDVDAMDSFAKMLGLQPGSVAKLTRVLSDEVQNKNMVTMMEAAIADSWAQGVHDKDPDQVAKARETLKSWNENNSESRIVIKPTQILSRVKKMNDTRAQRFIKTVPRDVRANVVRELQ